MKHSPLDIHHKRFRHSIKGYNVEEVTAFLAEISETVSDLIRDSNQIKSQISEKDKLIQDGFLRESTLKETIASSQKLVEAVRNEMNTKLKTLGVDAEKKAEKMLKDAKESAEKILSEAKLFSEEAFQKARTESQELMTKTYKKADEIVQEAHRTCGKINADAQSKADTILEQAIRKKLFLEKITLDLTHQKEELRRSIKNVLDLHYELVGTLPDELSDLPEKGMSNVTATA